MPSHMQSSYYMVLGNVIDLIIYKIELVPNIDIHIFLAESSFKRESPTITIRDKPS